MTRTADRASARPDAPRYSRRALLSGFALLLLVVAGITAVSLRRLADYGASLEAAITETDAARVVQTMRRASRERGLLLARLVEATDAIERAELVERFHEYGEQFAVARADYQRINSVDEAELQLLGEVLRHVRDTTPWQEQVIELALEGRRAAARGVLFDAALPAQDRAIARLDELIALENAHAAAARAQAQTERANAIAFLLIAGTAGVLLLIVIGMRTVRRETVLVGAMERASGALAHSLRELELQKRALDEHSIVGVTDRAGRISYVNDRFLEVSLYGRDELLGQDHRILNSGYHPREFFRQMWATIGRGRVWHGEIRNRRKDGSFYWVETTIVPFPGPTGKPERYVSIRTDITERKQTELALAEKQRRLSEAERMAHLGYWQLELAGHRIQCSEAVCELLGRQPHPLGSSLDQFADHIHPQDRERVLEWLRIVAANATGYDFDFRIRRGDDGRERIVHARGRVERDPDGAARFLTGTLQDITERKAAEIELVNARDAALAAAHARGQFIATISHEIRTPMNGVLGTLSLLRDSGIEARQRELVDVAFDSAQALMRLLNDVLDQARIESGQLRIHRTNFDLGAVVTGAVELFQGTAAAKGVALASAIHPRVARAVHGDADRLRQVLTNLVANAVKFTERGEINVRVRRVSTGLPGTGPVGPGSAGSGTEVSGAAPGPPEPASGPWDSRLRFEVSDTGIGIPVEAHERIFEVFTQADGSTTRRYGGSGLGLTIARQLVQLMGGVIGVDSAPGQGSTFWFTVPLPPADSAPPPEPAPPPVVAADTGFDARVLVVDDNAANRRIARRMLERLGCRVDAAGGGEEAVARVHTTRYDLVVMDCQMPGLDGYEAARQIRRRESGVPGAGVLDPAPRTRDPRLIIVAFTADAMAETRDRCRAAGMDDLLTKPVTLASFRSLLDRWLPQVRIERPPPDPGPAVEGPTLDPATIAGLEQLLGEGFDSLIAEYRQATTTHLAALHAALARRDAAAVRAATHALKGVSANIGAREVVATCRELEGRDAETLLELAPRILERLRRDLARVHAALAAHRPPPAC